MKSIVITKTSDKHLFSDFISRTPNSITLGEESSYTSSYEVLEIRDPKRSLLGMIGIRNNQNSVDPEYIDISDRYIVIAENEEIVRIAIPEFEIDKRCHLDTFFSELIYSETEDRIIIICVANLYCLSSALDIIWTIETDLIEDYRLLGNQIFIKTEDGIQGYRCSDGLLVNNKSCKFYD